MTGQEWKKILIGMFFVMGLGAGGMLWAQTEVLRV
jgi:hypothetical protein